MIRPLHPNEVSTYKDEWNTGRFVIYKDVIDTTTPAGQAWHRHMSEELECLDDSAPAILLNPTSQYRHIKPIVLLSKTRADFFKEKNCLSQPNPNHSVSPSWALLSFYQQNALLDFIQSITGWTKVHRIPLKTKGEFEINGKVNFYRASDKSRLDWHFDKVYNLKGRQVVCVLTLQNSWDSQLLKPHTLQIIDSRCSKKKVKEVYLGGNCMSIHDPDTIFHRVLPFTCPDKINPSEWTRRVLVLRFTDDPTPTLPFQMTVGAVRFASRHVIFSAQCNREDIELVSIKILLCILSFFIVMTIFARTTG